MKNEPGRVTQGQARLLFRVLALTGIICALAGMLLLLAPSPKMPALKDVAQAAPRRFINYTLMFPKYRDLTSTRTTPFEFQEMVRIKVQLKVKDPPPPPPPKPDITNLALVGTAPSASSALAVLHDTQSNKMKNIALGDQVRNSVVKNIYADKIILALNAEEAELALTPVKGSENLQRQLQGLPPLPNQQPSENKRAIKKSTPAPVQATGNTVLVASSSQAPPSIVTQALSSRYTTRKRSQQSGQPGSSPQQPGNESSSPASQNSATEQPQPGTGSSSPSSQSSGTTQSGGADPSQNQGSSTSEQKTKRSLGISGHMMSLEQQQELGLRESGLLVTSVRNSSSPIQANDAILSIAGKSFDSLGEAQNILQSTEGSAVQLKIYRNGTSQQISAPLN